MHEEIITTTRLILRQWLTTDYESFIAMNKDEKVMEYFPGTLSREETLKQIERIQSHFKEHDYGPYVAERKDNGRFIGFVGFAHPQFESYFTPCVEVAWRLNRESQGFGFATEAAMACLQYGFEYLGFSEIYSFTSSLNRPSINVMRKTGMHFEGLFEHPMIEYGHRLKTHVLYKIEHNKGPSIKFTNLSCPFQVI